MLYLVEQAGQLGLPLRAVADQSRLELRAVDLDEIDGV